jgi:hypothetical protein
MGPADPQVPGLGDDKELSQAQASVDAAIAEAADAAHPGAASRRDAAIDDADLGGETPQPE